eukprot:4886142-Pyramimonas_sp.AAC.1
MVRKRAVRAHHDCMEADPLNSGVEPKPKRCVSKQARLLEASPHTLEKVGAGWSCRVCEQTVQHEALPEFACTPCAPKQHAAVGA